MNKILKYALTISICIVTLSCASNVAEAAKKNTTTISSLKGTPRCGFKIKIKKIKNSKYQIRYSVNKNMGDAIKVSSKSPTVKVKKLKANTKYYVQARTFKRVNGKKVYSEWSKVKGVKTSPTYGTATLDYKGDSKYYYWTLGTVTYTKEIDETGPHGETKVQWSTKVKVFMYSGGAKKFYKYAQKAFPCPGVEEVEVGESISKKVWVYLGEIEE